MRLKAKIALTTSLWTVAIAGTFAFTIDERQAVGLWSLIAAAAAAVLSAALAGDFIADEAVKRIMEQVAAERQATVDQAVREMREDAQRREDRTVSRLKEVNEAAVRRVAVDVARAVAEEEPRRIH